MLDNGCRDQSDEMSQAFDWTDCEGAEAYELHRLAKGAGRPMRAELRGASEHRESLKAYSGADGEDGWTWKVRAKVDGSWGPWSEERPYRLEPADTDCRDEVEADPEVCVPRLLGPAPGAVLDNGCRSQADEMIQGFDWSDCEGAQAYELRRHAKGARQPIVNAVPEGSAYGERGRAYSAQTSKDGWTWQVRARVGGRWGAWSAPRTYTLEPVNTDCPPRRE